MPWRTADGWCRRQPIEVFCPSTQLRPRLMLGDQLERRCLHHHAVPAEGLLIVQSYRCWRLCGNLKPAPIGSKERQIPPRPAPSASARETLDASDRAAPVDKQAGAIEPRIQFGDGVRAAPMRAPRRNSSIGLRRRGVKRKPTAAISASPGPPSGESQLNGVVRDREFGRIPV